MGFSWLDGLLVLFIAFHLWSGTQIGFLLGAWNLLSFGLSMVGAFYAAPALTAATGWPVPLLTLLVFMLLLTLGRVATGLLIRRMHPVFERRTRLRKLDRVFGVVPGLGWGAAGAAVLVWLTAAFMGELPADAQASRWVLAAAEKPLALLGRAIPTELPGIAMGPDGWQFVMEGPTSESKVAPQQLEKQMLDLVNAERKKQKLNALAWDGRLAVVGRAHSANMAKLNYFAHEDKNGGSVATRVAAAGIPYLLVGENLAFAPTLAIAHTGLMNSPGHRANILRPGFRRAGIGILRLPPGSKYAPTIDGKAQRSPIRGVGGYLLITQVFKN